MSKVLQIGLHVGLAMTAFAGTSVIRAASQSEDPPATTPQATRPARVVHRSPEPPIQIVPASLIESDRTVRASVRNSNGKAKLINSSSVLVDDRGRTTVSEKALPVVDLPSGGSAQASTVVLPGNLADGYYRATIRAGWKEGNDMGTVSSDIYLHVSREGASVVSLDEWLRDSNALFATQRKD
jgi:hypothetical protein